MASVRKLTSILFGNLPMREGSAPWGHYWGMPIIAILAAACIWVTLYLDPGTLGFSVAALTAGLVVAAALFHTLRSLEWERETQRKRLTALEWVIDIIMPMGTDAGSEAETLRRLPDSVRMFLNMKMSIVALIEDEGRVLHVASSSGINPSLDGRSFLLKDLPLTRAAVEQKYVLSVADTHHPQSPVNSGLARELGLRAMVQIPMVYQGNVLGVMVLGDDRPHIMTELDTRRSWLWGCIGAVVLSHSRIYSAMGNSIRQQQIVMEHRNALYELNTAIQRPGTIDEILRRIVELAPAPLAVDAAMVWLVADDNGEELIIRAVTGPQPTSPVGTRRRINASRIGEILLARRMVVVEDVQADDSINADVKRRMAYGSIIYQPLYTGDGQPIGVLKLMRTATGPFRPEQLELARLFSQRVAATIEMARLHQQAREDGDAKAELLRELNHRVKNNLSAIVSLLSIHQPPLGPEARRWLDRVIDRIGAMAQAHELFRAGAHRVTLEELIHRTVQSLSVVKPAAVAVHMDLADGKTFLRTERAVKLAMAIHELCFNSIVHGLGEQGTLTIRTRRDNGFLAVEISDDNGTELEPDLSRQRAENLSPDAVISANSHEGIGLSLVRGLVGRELHGQFQLAPVPGGAVATVQFPLLADESGATTL